jgi:hypothetical protein
MKRHSKSAGGGPDARRAKLGTRHEVVGLSGLSRRSYGEDGSAASAKRMGVPLGNSSRGTAGLVPRPT